MLDALRLEALDAALATWQAGGAGLVYVCVRMKSAAGGGLERPTCEENVYIAALRSFFFSTIAAFVAFEGLNTTRQINYLESNRVKLNCSE